MKEFAFDGAVFVQEKIVCALPDKKKECVLKTRVVLCLRPHDRSENYVSIIL
jgi:hypothetical protein